MQQAECMRFVQCKIYPVFWLVAKEVFVWYPYRPQWFRGALLMMKRFARSWLKLITERILNPADRHCTFLH